MIYREILDFKLRNCLWEIHAFRKKISLSSEWVFQVIMTCWNFLNQFFAALNFPGSRYLFSGMFPSSFLGTKKQWLIIYTMCGWRGGGWQGKSGKYWILVTLSHYYAKYWILVTLSHYYRMPYLKLYSSPSSSPSTSKNSGNLSPATCSPQTARLEAWTKPYHIRYDTSAYLPNTSLLHRYYIYIHSNFWDN